MGITFTDRYSATGTPHPNPWTTCKGPCEGLGVHPMPYSEWLEARPRPHLCPQKDENGQWESFPPEDPDEWIFVYCMECNGSGRRITGSMGKALDWLHTWYYPPRMFVFVIQQRRFFAEAGYPRGRWNCTIPHALHLFVLVWREQRAQRALLQRRG